MKEFIIRYATIDDTELLSEIGAETFWETYHRDSHLEQEYIRAHIAETFNRKQIKSELQKQDIFYLIAENEQETIGYVRLLSGNTRDEIRAKNPLEISRIYLRTNFQGRNFGAKLLESCVKEARIQNRDVLWLSVWKYNQRAIKFYKKQGFYKVGEHIFDLAGSPQIDFLMQKDLEVKR